MTKKEFSKKCREIMASTALTELGKKAEIEHAATMFIENIIHRDGIPEILSIEERERAIENKFIGRKGRTTYCPECGTWSPEEPPEIKALSVEWSNIKDRKVNETLRKVLTGKAA